MLDAKYLYLGRCKSDVICDCGIGETTSHDFGRRGNGVT